MKTKGKRKGEKNIRGKRGRERVKGRRKRERGEGRGREGKGKGKEGFLVAHQVCTDKHPRSAQSSPVHPANKCLGAAQVLDKHKVTCLPASTGTWSHSHVPRNRLLRPACLPSPVQLSQA